MTTYAPSNPVPTADTADNVNAGDVIGNKTDTVAGDSLVALNKQILAAGVLTDAEIDDIKAGEYGVFTLPYNATTVTCTDSNGSGAYTPGTYVQIDDGTDARITNDYKIVGVCWDTPSAAMVARISIGVGAGAAEVEQCSIPIEVATDAGAWGCVMIPPTGRITGGTRVAARVGTAADSGQTLKIGVLVQRVS